MLIKKSQSYHYLCSHAQFESKYMSLIISSIITFLVKGMRGKSVLLDVPNIYI